MKVGIVCSHGGHLTEIRYLIEKMPINDYFFITYDSAVTRNMAYPVYLFQNFGRKPWKMLLFVKQFMKILKNEQPDYLLSNGSEIAIPVFLLAKIMGIRIIFIECFTRIQEPTITGKILSLVSDVFIIPWIDLKNYYGTNAFFCGSLITEPKIINEVNEKRGILVIVGMHDHGFERLVKKIDELAKKSSYEITIQIGSSIYKPENCNFFDYCSYEEMIILIQKSRLVICQGGMTIIDCLLNGTSVVTVPRKKEFGEVINDHQYQFSNQLEKMGLVTVAYDISNIEQYIANELASPSKLVKINEQYIENIMSLINKVLTLN